MRTFGERINVLLEKSNNNSYINTESTPDYNNDILLELPLKNNDDLLDFEKKLLTSSFKMKIVSYVTQYFFLIYGHN